MDGQSELRFAWWNVQNFAHFDESKPVERGWPKSEEHYAAKCRAIDSAFDSMFGSNPPDLIGLCEITETAAQELQQRKLPDFELIHPGATPNIEFQIAVFFRKNRGLRGLTPVIAEDVPVTTRAMPVIQFSSASNSIRFIFCHWTAFGNSVKKYRGDLADAVRRYAYEFLFARRADKARQFVVIGDLNSEPFDSLFRERLQSCRDRDSATRRHHPKDRPVRRVRLYNCGWKHLGERLPHEPTGEAVHSAGSYFGKDGWRTYDQVLVSGGLLSDSPPYLDESSVKILALSEVLGAKGKPQKFEYKDGRAIGLSDHLPLSGRIILE